MIFFNIIRRISTVLIILSLVQSMLCPLSVAQAQEDTNIKELNFVFLHGLGGNSCTLQLLSDLIREKISDYEYEYEILHPNTDLQFSFLNRCYPNNVNLGDWSANIADTINEFLPDKKNVVLIGHSMGGKAALHAVYRNVDNIYDKVLMVVTINSPVNRLDDYYAAGGGPVETYCRTGITVPDLGACESLTYYDSCIDGRLVSQEKHWLAFVSSEPAPLSPQFNFPAVDGWPRDMDDGLVPISAQYCAGADVIYYGEYGHSDFAIDEKASKFMSERILRYIFGKPVECSVITRKGTFQHQAGWLPGTDRWEDVVGKLSIDSGSIEYTNTSLFKWQQWEEIIGQISNGTKRDGFLVEELGFFPLFAGVIESNWFSPDTEDNRVYLKTRVAPADSASIEWTIYIEGLLPEGIQRDHFEVRITTGTPLSRIIHAAWLTADARDLRVRVISEADRPFRWFKAEWRVFNKETRQRQVLDSLQTT